MKIWSIVSQKGGSGKTTLALHLAIAATAKGRKTLVIDLDPQTSAERWAEIRDQDEPAIVAGEAEKLTEMLSAANAHGADLVIVDTPPKVDRTALIAAKAADVVLIPSRGTILDLPAIGDTINLLKLASLEGKAAIVLNAMSAKGAPLENVKEAAEQYGLEIIPALLADRPSYSRSLETGQGVTEKEPKGKAASEIWDVYQRLCQRDGTAPPLRKAKRARS
jgi:chromosome partitioning protein